MDNEKLEYDIQKRARAGTAATARAAVALYIIWLGIKVIRGVVDGSSTIPAALGWAFGIFFIAAALFFGRYVWKRWRADVEAARIPVLPEEGAPESED